MNRIILVGNGFDLAHKLKTGYKDFINWYYNQLVDDLHKCESNIYADGLCILTLHKQVSWKSFIDLQDRKSVV